MTGEQPAATTSKRTTSTTVVVGAWTYIFLNRPETDYIDWICFTDPTDPKRGKIENITAKHGPITAIGFSDNSIRLYYTGVSGSTGALKGLKVVREVQLLKADDKNTDPTKGWTKPLPSTNSEAKKSELNFEANIAEGNRLLHGLSFLSSSTKKTDSGLISVVTYQNEGESHYTYCERQKSPATGVYAWVTQQLQLNE